MKAAFVMSITLISWRVGLTVDVTVINSLQPLYVTKASVSVGAVAEAGEEQKDIYHEDKVLAGGGLFSPGGETLGLWSLRSIKRMKIIASKTSAVSAVRLYILPSL